MQIPNLATAAAAKAKNTAANPDTPTATASVSNQKPVKIMENILHKVNGLMIVQCLEKEHLLKTTMAAGFANSVLVQKDGLLQAHVRQKLDTLVLQKKQLIPAEELINALNTHMVKVV